MLPEASRPCRMVQREARAFRSEVPTPGAFGQRSLCDLGARGSPWQGRPCLTLPWHWTSCGSSQGPHSPPACPCRPRSGPADRPAAACARCGPLAWRAPAAAPPGREMWLWSLGWLSSLTALLAPQSRNCPSLSSWDPTASIKGNDSSVPRACAPACSGLPPSAGPGTYLQQVLTQELGSLGRAAGRGQLSGAGLGPPTRFPAPPPQGAWTPVACSAPPRWGHAGWPVCPVPVGAHSMGREEDAGLPPPPGLCPEWVAGPQGPAVGHRARPLFCPPRRLSACLERGGLGRPQEWEVWEPGLLWARGPCWRAHRDAEARAGWPGCPGTHRQLCHCETRAGLWTPGPLPWGHRMGNSSWGRSGGRAFSGSPNFRPLPHQLRSWGRAPGDQGHFHLGWGKAEAGRGSRRPVGGRRGQEGAGQGPAAARPDQDWVCSPPPRSGPPPPNSQKWLTVPIVQRAQVRPGRTAHSEAEEAAKSPRPWSGGLPGSRLQSGWGAPSPGASSARSRAAIGGEEGGQGSGGRRAAAQLSPPLQCPPTLRRPLGSCGASAGLEGG